MQIVFCVDRRVLPGLHVAAYSLLDRIGTEAGQTHITIFSNELDKEDLGLLRQSLASLNKPCSFELRPLDSAAFKRFPLLNGSHAAYYRLFAAQNMEVERFLYVDADTLCDIDVSELQSLYMGTAPAAWVPEAPLARAVDRRVAEQLGNSETEPYFNSGIILVNVQQWRRQRITESAMEYIATLRPAYHDQSALNVILRGISVQLDDRFNCIANMRKNWPHLCLPLGQTARLVHYVDYPKPWDFLGEFVHPQYQLWRSVLEKTAMKDFRSWHASPSRKFPKTRNAWAGYKKAFKDRLLFEGYSRNWIRNIKGVPVARMLTETQKSA